VPVGAAIYAPVAVQDPAFARQLADGETVILAIRPSLWFVFIRRAGWLGTLVTVCLLLALIDRLGLKSITLYPLALALILVAVIVLAWQVTDRLCRLYVLTDKRIIRISGVFSRTTVEIPLHKVTTVALHRTFLDRLLGVGSILFTSAASGADSPAGDLVWYIVDKPVAVVKTVRDTLSRYGGGGGGGATPGPAPTDRPFGAAS
jgi:membrane protein YdbS with pleckstrin-like domain